MYCRFSIPCIEDFVISFLLFLNNTKVTITFQLKKACISDISFSYSFHLKTKAECMKKMLVRRRTKISYLKQFQNLLLETKADQKRSCSTTYPFRPNDLAELLKEENTDIYKYVLKKNVEVKRPSYRNHNKERVSLKRIVMPSAFKVHPVKLAVGLVEQILGRYFTPSPPTKRETMAYELLRLCTLHDFPKSTGQSCIRLAQAGFFYEGKDDEVTCFSCTIQICGWQPQDIPLDRHRQTSPNCLFIRCQNSGNVPIAAPERVEEAATSAVKSGGCGETFASSKANFVLEKPGSSFDSGYQTASSSAVVNFASTPSVPQSRVSFDSGYGLQSSTSGQPSGSSSISNSQPCVTTSESSSRTGITDSQTATLYTVTSTNRNRAHYPEYVLVNDRLRSFDRGWPDYVSQTPQMMVESGFFFAGYEDCVRCFQCGIGLRNWEPPDSPHVEHARWSPKCPFLLGVKGQDFINLVLDAVAQLALRNEQTGYTPETLTESNPGKAVLLQQTNQQSQQRSTTTRNTVTTGTDAGRSVTTTSQSSTTNAVKGGISQADVVKTEEAKKVLKKGFSENEVRRAIEKIVEKDGSENVTEKRILKTLLEDKGKTPGLRGGEAVQTNALPADIVELKKKNREMREMTICKICLEEEVSIVFLPCGHLVACVQCAPALSRCAVCRKPITGTICAHLDV